MDESPAVPALLYMIALESAPPIHMPARRTGKAMVPLANAAVTHMNSVLTRIIQDEPGQRMLRAGEGGLRPGHIPHREQG